MVGGTRPDSKVQAISKKIETLGELEAVIKEINENKDKFYIINAIVPRNDNPADPVAL